MSRFSGLSSAVDLTASNQALRFAGLREALSVRAGNSVRLAAHIAEKNGLPVAAAPVAANAAVSAAPAQIAPKRTASTPVKPAPMNVPPEVEARGPVYADAYRASFKRVAGQLSRLKDHSAAQGRLGSVLELIAKDMSDDQIIARLPSSRTDRQRAADAVWDRAIAQVCGTPNPAAQANPSPAEAVWDRAAGRAATVPSDPKQQHAADVWAKAHAAVGITA